MKWSSLAVTFCASFLIWNANNTKAQNLFDSTNTYKYFNYLYSSKQFAAALNESNSLITTSNYPTIFFTHLQCCRLANNKEAFEKAYQSILVKPLSADSFLQTELLKGFITFKLLHEGELYFNQLNDGENKNLLLRSWCVLNENSAKAFQIHKALLASKCNKDSVLFTTFFMKQKQTNYKSLPLAITLSAIVPGAGKVYAGYWQDGLVSFLMTAGNGFQTYRSFNRKGANTALGYLTGGLFALFYSANIYGTVKAVKKKNKALYQKNITPIVENIFNDN
jgi:hypothetical protein